MVIPSPKGHPVLCPLKFTSSRNFLANASQKNLMVIDDLPARESSKANYMSLLLILRVKGA